MRYKEFTNTVKPSIPYFFAYDIGGGQAFGTDYSFHTYDTVIIQTSHFEYTADTNRIYLTTNSSGFYKITVQCSYSASANNIYACSCMGKNGVSNDCSYTLADIGKNDKGELSAVCVIFLQKGDYLQIATKSNTGTLTTIANTSKIIIEGIPMAGYNNQSGGTENKLR